MEAVNYKVLNMEGKEVGSMELDPEIFQTKVDQKLVQQTVVWQLNCRRAGTHSAKTRAEVSGGGRKPWPQKGRGTARSGSNTSPVWVGGGVAHGPKPRDYSTRVSKRTRRQALLSVLTEKVNQKQLVILDDLQIESGKTKQMQQVLKNIGIAAGERKGIAIIMPDKQEAVWRSSRNIPRTVTLPVAGVNVYDLMKAKYLISTKQGITALQIRLKGVGEEGAEA